LPRVLLSFISSFFFTPQAATEIYTLSLHDALPIFRNAKASCRNMAGAPMLRTVSSAALLQRHPPNSAIPATAAHFGSSRHNPDRSEEHTSELQSRENLVCRLLLEKKKKDAQRHHSD